MDRRGVLIAFGILFLTCPQFAAAQNAVSIPRIGVLIRDPLEEVSGANPTNAWARAFRRDLAERGWNDGKNINIVWRSGASSEVSTLLDELVQIPVDLLVVRFSFAAVEARKKTERIPIVVRDAFYPVEAGLADSLSRPGRNVTGTVANSEGLEINRKQLALLKEAAPSVSRVLYLTAPLAMNEDRFAAGGVDGSGIPNRTVAAAAALGVSLSRLAVAPKDSRSSVEAMLAKELQRGINGVFVDTQVQEHAIVRFIERHKLPATYTFETGLEAGGLMYYGPTAVEAARQTASQVHRILKGAKASELAFEAPTRFTLTVSKRAAKKIGLTFPSSIRVQAEGVLE